MFLVDASASTRETFRAYVRVVGLEDAPDLAATTFEAAMRTLTHLFACRQSLLLGHLGCVVFHFHGMVVPSSCDTFVRTKLRHPDSVDDGYLLIEEKRLHRVYCEKARPVTWRRGRGSGGGKEKSRTVRGRKPGCCGRCSFKTDDGRTELNFVRRSSATRVSEGG